MPKSKTLILMQPRKPKPRKPELWKLRLYIAGQTPTSIRAIRNLNLVCEQHLKGHYQIEVIDLLVTPHLARGNQIVALPTLERELPEPIRRIIGDLSDTERVLIGMALEPIV